MDSTPTQAEFITFLRDIVDISTTYLPDDSVYITFAYEWAVQFTNEWLVFASGEIYTQAVYNLGADTIINYAQDQTGETYFADLRAKWGIYNFVAGVATSAGDAGTTVSHAVPTSLTELSLSDLQNLKTPWGRAYLAISQKFGTAWGLS